MKVKIGNYLIYNIPLNIVLAEVIKTKDGKEDKKIHGYYSNVGQAVESLLCKKMNETNARTVQGLKDHIDKAKKELIAEIRKSKVLKNLKPMGREEDLD